MRFRSLLVAMVVLGVASPVTAQVYTWTDENGVVHYTADPSTIPPQLRPGDLPAPAPPRAPGGWESWGTTPAVVAPAGITVRFTPGEPIVVNGHLNGVPIALLLDTGADRTLLSPAAVERAGFGKMTVTEAAAVRVLGVTGSAVATVLTVPLLDIAGARIGPLSLVVHDAGLGGLDGLLGRDVLDAFTVTIDTAGGRATLVPR
jgi:hypothetical protein